MTAKTLLATAMIWILCGCASYTTPGGAARLDGIVDPDVASLMAAEPAAQFPARLATARIQAPGYRTQRSQSFGEGGFSVVLAREVESPQDDSRLESLPDMTGIAPLNRMLLPDRLDSIADLRVAAARLKADILLIYTFDTAIHAGEQRLAPLNVVSLGFLRNKPVAVTTTVSAALFDVRSEYLYGVAEATSRKDGMTSVWSSAAALDDLRLANEKDAYSLLVPELERTWTGIVSEYAPRARRSGT